jgi:hypothetical protein
MADTTAASVVGRIRYYVTHPASVAGFVTAVVGALLQLPVVGPLGLALWASLGKLLAMLGLLVTIAPYVDGLPHADVIAVLVIVTVAALLKRGIRFLREFASNYDRFNDT